jgi:Flp pilus assembly protein protease CpaA
MPLFNTKIEENTKVSMLEDFLFGNLTMDGEIARIVLALLGTAIGAYFDVYNKRNVPNNFLFAFLASAILINFIFFNVDLIIYSFFVVGALAIVGYVFYVMGYMGGADIFIIASLALLLPIPPSFSEITINYPFILFILIFSFIVSAFYLFVYFSIKLMNNKNAKPDSRYFILLVPYALIVYMVINMPFFSPLFFFVLSATLLLSIFFMAYRQAINRMMAQKIALEKVEEGDVLALDFMDKDLVWRYKLQRLVTEDELKRLKALKIKELVVYTKLPPFLPFIFIGLLLALVFSKYLLLP